MGLWWKSSFDIVVASRQDETRQEKEIEHSRGEGFELREEDRHHDERKEGASEEEVRRSLWFCRFQGKARAREEVCRRRPLRLQGVETEKGFGSCQEEGTCEEGGRNLLHRIQAEGTCEEGGRNLLHWIQAKASPKESSEEDTEGRDKESKRKRRPTWHSGPPLLRRAQSGRAIQERRRKILLERSKGNEREGSASNCGTQGLWPKGVCSYGGRPG